MVVSDQSQKPEGPQGLAGRKSQCELAHFVTAG